MKKSLIIIAMFFTLFTLTACDSDIKSELPETFTVTFRNINNTVYESQNVTRNGLLTVPQVTKEGHQLIGWFRENSFLNQWNFNIDRVNANINLYAQWQANLITHSVTFNLDLTGNSLLTNTVENNTRVTRPSAPTRDQYNFLHWSLSTNLTIPFDFNTLITSDIILIAQWERIINQFTINFETNGGSFIESITQNEGTQILLSDNPVLEGFEFVGWFYDEKEITFPHLLTQDITVNAKWQYAEIVGEVGARFIRDGIWWIILYIDNFDNALIITYRVQSAGVAMNTGGFVHLQDTDRMRPALNAWWNEFIGDELNMRARNTLGHDSDFRNAPNNFNSNENQPAGRTTAGDLTGSATDLFILSISEVNHYFPNLEDRAAQGYYFDTGWGRDMLFPMSWWTRSPGAGAGNPWVAVWPGGTGVGSAPAGSFTTITNPVGNYGANRLGMRPALWIDLS